MEKLDLFTAGQNDYMLYHIPGLVVTAKGTVLAYCEARRNRGSDWDAIDLLLRRSRDGGRTWDPPRRIGDVSGPHPKHPLALAQKLVKPDAGVTYNNPVALADRDGAVHMLFCIEYARCFYMRSDDDGATWSTPAEITSALERLRPKYDWKVLATGPGHGIELRSGRLIVPVWLSTGNGSNAHRPSLVATVYSDDHGRTWQAGDIAIPNTSECVSPGESTIVRACRRAGPAQRPQRVRR